MTSSSLSFLGRGRAGRQKGSIFAKAPQAHCVLDSALAPRLGGAAVLQRQGLAKVSPPLVPPAWAMQQGVSYGPSWGWDEGEGEGVA